MNRILGIDPGDAFFMTSPKARAVCPPMGTGVSARRSLGDSTRGITEPTRPSETNAEVRGHPPGLGCVSGGAVPRTAATPQRSNSRQPGWRGFPATEPSSRFQLRSRLFLEVARALRFSACLTPFEARAERILHLLRNTHVLKSTRLSNTVSGTDAPWEAGARLTL